MTDFSLLELMCEILSSNSVLRVEDLEKAEIYGISRILTYIPGVPVLVNQFSSKMLCIIFAPVYHVCLSQ